MPTDFLQTLQNVTVEFGVDRNCGVQKFGCSKSFQHDCPSPPPLLAGAGSLRPLYLPQEEVQAEGSPFQHSGGDPKCITDGVGYA